MKYDIYVSFSEGFSQHPGTKKIITLDMSNRSDWVRSGLTDLSLRHSCVVLARHCSIQLPVDPHPSARLHCGDGAGDESDHKVPSDQIILSVLQVLFTISRWAFRCLLQRRGFPSAIKTRWQTFWNFLPSAQRIPED